MSGWSCGRICISIYYLPVISSAVTCRNTYYYINRFTYSVLIYCANRSRASWRANPRCSCRLRCHVIAVDAPGGVDVADDVELVLGARGADADVASRLVDDRVVQAGRAVPEGDVISGSPACYRATSACRLHKCINSYLASSATTATTTTCASTASASARYSTSTTRTTTRITTSTSTASRSVPVCACAPA